MIFFTVSDRSKCERCFARNLNSIFVRYVEMAGSCLTVLLFFLLNLQVRIQLGQGSAGTVTRNMLKNEGVGAFYKVLFLFSRS